MAAINNNRIANEEDQAPLYVGNWTEEEKIYAKRLMQEFRDGNLPELQDEKEPVLLRAFLAKKLHCNPKRVSKKYENTQYNGRERYDHGKRQLSSEESARRAQELERLRQEFLQSRGQLVDLQQHGIHFVIRHRNAGQGPARAHYEAPAIRVPDDRPPVQAQQDPQRGLFGALLLNQALARSGAPAPSVNVVPDDSSSRAGALGLLGLASQQQQPPQRVSGLENMVLEALAGRTPNNGGLSRGPPPPQDNGRAGQLMELYRLLGNGSGSDQVRETILNCAISEILKSSTGSGGNTSAAARLPQPPAPFMPQSSKPEEQLIRSLLGVHGFGSTNNAGNNGAPAAATTSQSSQDILVSALASQLLGKMPGTSASSGVGSPRTRFSAFGDDGPASKRARNGY